MNQLDPEVQSELDAVRRDFESRLGTMIADIADTWEKTQLSNDPVVGMKRVGELAHSLAGNAGIFGQRQISGAATDLEVAIDGRLAATDDFESHRIKISRLLSDLQNKFAEMDAGS